MRSRRHTSVVLTVLLPLLLLLLPLAACRNPLVSADGQDGRGVLRLTVVRPDTVGTLTLTPDSTITHYQISGSTDAGLGFERTVDAGEGSQTVVEQHGLLAGLWNIRVDARNAAGETILTGTTAVLIKSSETAVADLLLTDPEGNGTLTFRLEWDNQLLSNVAIEATLEPADGGAPPDALSFAVDHQDGSAQYSGEWPAGFHILTVTLLEDGHAAWGDSYAVQLTASAVTAKTVLLTAADLDLPPGPGSGLWTFTAGDSFSSSIWSSPAIGPDGTIYVGSDNNRLYAVNPLDGSKLWHFQTGGRVYSSPAVGPDGVIYVGSHDGNVYAVDANGDQEWAFLTGGWVRSSPAIGAEGTIYVGSNDGYLYAINSANGSELWNYHTGDNVVSSPAVLSDNGVDVAVFFGSQNGTVYAVDAAEGTLIWSFSTADWVYSSPAIGPGVNGAQHTIYVGSYDGTLYALDAANGAVLWDYDAEDWIGSSPAVGPDGTVYVGSRNGLLHAVNGATGAEIWTFDAGPGGVYSSPAVGNDGTIYVGSYDRSVYAVDSDGNQLWRFETGIGGVFSSPAIGAGGRLYVGARDGNLYALRTSASGPAQSAWPMFGRNARRTALTE